MIHRDQIHGDVRFDPLGVALLNTEALQRLGRVYQLGYAHLVYRGGTHTRLSHVMGSSHVAGWLVDQLRQNYLEAGGELPAGAVNLDNFLPVGRAQNPGGAGKGSLDARWDVLRHLVRWAALLHDIGHVPLGHTLEDEFEGIYKKHDDFESPRIPYLWYEVSAGEDSEIRRVFRRPELLPKSFIDLGIDGETAWQSVMLICLHKEKSVESSRRTSFKELLSKEVGNESEAPFLRVLRAALEGTENRTFFPYMADIVGNTVCADYFDYLRRDPMNVGLDVLRDNRVAARFFVGKDANCLLRMALALVDKRGKPRLDTCTGVVELVRQRFRFAEIIYYHKTKVAASAMLAKIFNLIGKPDEVGPPCSLIDIDSVADLAKDVLKGGAATLRRQCAPNSLLSPEIGDETLLFWLQQRGWDSLVEAGSSNNVEKATECLRGLSLLQGLVRRNLYKVCFTIDRRSYERLNPGSKEEPEIESRIKTTLDFLRKSDRARSDLEAAMAEAAGWPKDSVLLYVPPRKSQAKGIETGALDRGEVVTLGTHSAVRNEVAQLSRAYTGLWRIILLVHPKYFADAVGLSSAVDALAKGLWPKIDLNEAVSALGDAAWFSYIPSQQRQAADKYKTLASPMKPEWRSFLSAAQDTSSGTISTNEHALRGVLLLKIQQRGGSSEVVKGSFDDPESLAKRVSELESQLTLEGREGDDSPQAKARAALDRIAEDLLATHQPSLFKS